MIDFGESGIIWSGNLEVSFTVAFPDDWDACIVNKYELFCTGPDGISNSRGCPGFTWDATNTKIVANPADFTNQHEGVYVLML